MDGPLPIQVEQGGETFTFAVYRRDLKFATDAGDDGAKPCRYYWMDGRQLRAGRGGPNFRACVDFWWNAVEEAGADREEDNQVTLLLAECYPLVNTARALQDVFVDAHLRHNAGRESVAEAKNDGVHGRSVEAYSLPPQEIERLKALVAACDVDLIRQEFSSLFLGAMPRPEELPGYEKAGQLLFDQGLAALRTGGRDGLIEFTQTLDNWIRSSRRRGGQDRTRIFLNLFSYRCKVAFYTCYASAWTGILHTLSLSDADNQRGHRLMRLWHNQNNPSQVWLSDVFCHQVLALHPLSRSMLTAPEYLESIRAWIDHPSYDELHARARIGECREYWDVVTSILMAAHEYKYVRQLSSLQRPPHASTNQDALHEIPSAEESLNDDESTEDTARDLARAIEDYLVAREKRCTCATPNSPWKYVSHVLGQSRDHSAKVRVECPACRRETTINLDGTDMSTWLTER